MGRLVVEADGGEAVEVPLDGARRLLLLGELATWSGGRLLWLFLRLLPKARDLNRELIRSIRMQHLERKRKKEEKE